MSVSVTCPACAQVDTAESRPMPDREYGLNYLAHFAACPSCGTTFQEPMPRPDQLGDFYPSSYHSMVRQGRLARLRHDLRWKRLSKLVGEGPILDFGCGNGSFLLRAAEIAPDRAYYGFEIDDEPGVEKLAGGAVTLIRGDLPLLLEKLPQCGLVTMNHVIEHLPDPMEVLTALHKKLTPGGLIEGQTPAADSLEHRLFGDRWSGYHAPRHTVVFSRDGLAQVLGRAGYADVTVSAAFNPAGIAVSLASTRQNGDGGEIRREGFSWLGLLGVATLLAPIDLLSRSPGIVNFTALRGGD